MKAAVLQHKSLGWGRAAGRQLLVSLLLLTFVFQGYVTQTHVHEPVISITKMDLKGAAGHKKIPTNDDPANCPVCQQIMQAGQYVAPVWLLPLLITQAVARIEIATLKAPRYDAVSHAWHSRGPPQD